jgi:DNA-binding transcriptional ArsR family regulator
MNSGYRVNILSMSIDVPVYQHACAIATAQDSEREDTMKLPPSALLVLSLLSKGEALTHKEIGKLTGLPPRTVRYALQKLRERSLIREEWNFKDARQIRYRSGDEDDGMSPEPDVKVWRPGKSCRSSATRTQQAG